MKIDVKKEATGWNVVTLVLLVPCAIIYRAWIGSIIASWFFPYFNNFRILIGVMLIYSLVDIKFHRADYSYKGIGEPIGLALILPLSTLLLAYIIHLIIG
jgi:hypothetical protein